MVATALEEEVTNRPAVNQPTVYLAARFSLKDQIKQRANELRRLGVHVTSRWLDETISPNTSLKNVPVDYSCEVAVQDIQDIDAAEFFLAFSEDPDSLYPRGGRHVEFGYAYATGKKMLVCGPRENVFHYLPRVVVISDWRDVKDHLEFVAKRRMY